MEASEYSNIAAVEEQHWWYVGLHDLVICLIQAEAARRQRPLAILDAGCGTGRLCELMQPYGDVAGCDIHRLALEATANRGIKMFPCDLVHNELGVEQYDVITAIDVLYHRQVTDEAAVLHNVHCALRKGGLLLVQVAAFELLRGAHDVTVHTRRRFRRHQVVALLESAEFEIELATYRLLPFFVPAAVWRSFTRAFRRNSSNGSSDVVQTYSRRMNQLLTRYVKMENRWLTAGTRLPLGMSVFVVARR